MSVKASLLNNKMEMVARLTASSFRWESYFVFNSTNFIFLGLWDLMEWLNLNDLNIHISLGKAMVWERCEVDLGITRRGFLFTFTVLSLLHGCRGEISPNPPGGVTTRPPVKPGDGSNPDGEKGHLPLFTINYPIMQIPFEITLWMLLASFAKIGK